jgi:hypothetical protein
MTREELLIDALKFYADGKRYSGPNQRLVNGDKYTAKDAAYMKDVTRDGGAIARAALAELRVPTLTPADGGGK